MNSENNLVWRQTFSGEKTRGRLQERNLVKERQIEALPEKKEKEDIIPDNETEKRQRDEKWCKKEKWKEEKWEEKISRQESMQWKKSSRPNNIRYFICRVPNAYYSKRNFRDNAWRDAKEEASRMISKRKYGGRLEFRRYLREDGTN